MGQIRALSRPRLLDGTSPDCRDRQYHTWNQEGTRSAAREARSTRGTCVMQRCPVSSRRFLAARDAQLISPTAQQIQVSAHCVFHGVVKRSTDRHGMRSNGLMRQIDEGIPRSHCRPFAGYNNGGSGVGG